MAHSFVEMVKSARERAYNGEELSSVSTGGYEGHTISHELKHIGRGGLLFDTDWYYEAFYVDDKLVIGWKTDFPPDHPPTERAAKQAVESALKHAEDRPWYYPSPPKKAESQVSPGVLL